MYSLEKHGGPAVGEGWKSLPSKFVTLKLMYSAIQVLQASKGDSNGYSKGDSNGYSKGTVMVTVRGTVMVTVRGQ